MIGVGHAPTRIPGRASHLGSARRQVGPPAAMTPECLAFDGPKIPECWIDRNGHVNLASAAVSKSERA